MNAGDPNASAQLGPWRVAIVAGAVALTLRVIYVLILRGDVIFSLPIMDAAVHDGWARGDETIVSIFEKGVPYFRAPLYVWFLKLVYAIDDTYLAPRLVQALLSALTVGLITDLGRRFAGARAGLIGGLLLAISWPAIYFSGELLIVTFFMFVVVTGLWLLTMGVERDRLWMLLAGGLTIGVAACARPTALVLVPALAAAPWLALDPSSNHRLGRISRPGLAAMLVALTLLPGFGLTVRNQVVGGDWVFIASQGGVNLFIGNNPQADGRTAVVPGTRATWLGGYQDTQRMAEVAEGHPLRPSGVSAYFVRRSLASWREDPGAMLRLYAKKIRYLVGAGERPNNKNLHFWRSRNALLRQPFFVSWATLFSLGVVGIFLLERRRRAYFVWSFLGLYALGLLPFFLNERFRLPLMIGLAAFAGIPLARGMAALLLRRWRLAAVALVPVCVLFVASSLDRLDFRDDRIDADAFSHYTLGNLYLRSGDRLRALDEYQSALDIAHSFGLRNFDSVERMLRQSMVSALLEEHRFDEAEQNLRFLETQAPASPQVDLLRAQLALRKHDFDVAAPLFRKILQAVPDQPDALRGLGWCQLENRAFVAAEKSFRRSQEIGGIHAEALAGIGVAELLGNQNEVAARRLFEQALELDPRTAAAHQFLAEIYRRERNLSRMTYHLEEALRLDPYNTRVRRFYNRLQVPDKKDYPPPR